MNNSSLAVTPGNITVPALAKCSVERARTLNLDDMLAAIFGKPEILEVSTSIIDKSAHAALASRESRFSDRVLSIEYRALAAGDLGPEGLRGTSASVVSQLLIRSAYADPNFGTNFNMSVSAGDSLVYYMHFCKGLTGQAVDLSVRHWGIVPGGERYQHGGDWSDFGFQIDMNGAATMIQGAAHRYYLPAVLLKRCLRLWTSGDRGNAKVDDCDLLIANEFLNPPALSTKDLAVRP